MNVNYFSRAGVIIVAHHNPELPGFMERRMAGEDTPTTQTPEGRI
jgi:hypothetical protein